MNIGLVYDLRRVYIEEGWTLEEAAEFDSEETVEALDDAIRSHGHTTVRIGHGRELARRLVSGERWDLVFTIAEGRGGRNREAQVPCLLEMYGVPYTFSDPLVCAATLDKAFAKRIFQWAGIATPRFAVVNDLRDAWSVALDYPVFVKPVAEGTGKGVDGRSRVASPEQLREVCRDRLERYAQPVLVEEYLPGREFTTAVLGTGRQARVLGTLEVCVREGAPSPDYGLAVKEECERYVEYRSPPADRLRQAVETLALAAYRALECRDGGRIDLRLDRHGQPSVLEINPLPGLHPTHSDLPMIATREGMSYRELIGRILDSAMARGHARAGSPPSSGPVCNPKPS